MRVWCSQAFRLLFLFQLAKGSSSWLENLFLKLVETLTGWKTFSKTMQPARGLHVEKVFQAAKVAISLRTHGRKGFPTSQGSNQLENSFVEKVPTSQGSKQLEDSSKRFSNKVATSSRTRRRKGSPTKQCCNQVKDSSSKRFSQLGKESSSWLENLFLKLVETLAGWKTFSTTIPRAGCNIG